MINLKSSSIIVLTHLTIVAFFSFFYGRSNYMAICFVFNFGLLFITILNYWEEKKIEKIICRRSDNLLKKEYILLLWSVKEAIYNNRESIDTEVYDKILTEIQTILNNSTQRLEKANMSFQFVTS